MNFLVLYGTVEGHTRKIASRIHERLESHGHDATLADVVQPGSFGLGSFDAAILCAPIHIGQYPPPFVHYVTSWIDGLGEIATALVTVSLSIASDNDDEKTEAESFPRKLEAKTGWKADREHNAAGALKYVEYDYFKRWMMKRIAEEEDGPTDTSRDHELTDWPALDEFVDAFVNYANSR